MSLSNRSYEVDQAATEIRKTKRSEIYAQERKICGMESDSENRRNVKKLVEKYMSRGMSQEQAVDLIMQDEEIVSQFTYLIRNGLDLKTCFINWTKRLSYEKNKGFNNSGEER